MERLKIRAFAIGAFILVAGVAIQAMPRPSLHAKDEKFMEANAPKQVGQFTFVENPDKPGKSYDVDERTYELLKPFGVVGRIYANKDRSYDVLLISGNDKNCFHDNRVCFQGQGFTIVGQETQNIQTSRGTIPVTMLTLEHRERGRMMAAMFYKGPGNKWFALPAPLTWAMFLEQVKLGSDLNSTFYRVIPLHQNPDKAEFVQFIKDYVAEAQKTSNGFF
jgi:hypothetical protein